MCVYIYIVHTYTNAHIHKIPKSPSSSGGCRKGKSQQGPQSQRGVPGNMVFFGLELKFMVKGLEFRI